MKYAVVTGSTKGIGKAIACRLLKEGYYVFFNYSKDDDAAEKLKKEISEYKNRYSIIKKDLSSYNAATELISEVRKVSNKVDCVILNCGATDRSLFCDISKESWEYVINTNLSVPFYLVQGFYDCMPNNSNVIFIGSILGIYPHACSLSYAVSKAAIHQMAKELVKVFAEKEITVNAIAPGFTDTPWQNTKSVVQKKNIEDKIALKRFGYPEEIADICMAIINVPYINGSVIEVSGGYSYK